MASRLDPKQENTAAKFTKKREEHGTELRKKKRGEKLERKRFVNSGDASPEFAALFRSYNPAHMLKTRDIQQLVILHRALSVATDDDIFTHIEQLTPPPVLQLLVQTMMDPKLCEPALACLINTTTHKTDIELSVADVIIKSGFLRNMHALLQRSDLPNQIFVQLWEVVCNLCAMGVEVRDVIIESPIFMPLDKSVFAQLCGNAFFKGNTKEHMPILLDVMCAVVVSNNSTQVIMPDPLVILFWQHVVFFLLHRLAEQKEGTQQSLMTLRHLLKFLPTHDNDQFRIMLLKTIDLRAFFNQIFFIYTHTNEKHMHRMIVDICSRIASIYVPDSSLLTLMMRECGGLKIAMQALSHQGEGVRAQTFMWIGNYAADGLEFIKDLKLAGAFDNIFASLRRETFMVKKQAVYALMTIFKTLEHDFRTNMTLSSQCIYHMTELIRERDLFKWLASCLGSNILDKDLVADVLEFFCTCLSWNPDVTRGAIERADAPEKVAVMLAYINNLRGNQFGNVHKAAERFEKLWNGEELDGVESMDLEGLPPAGVDENGVLHGGWKF
jgi:hypothetical protein